MALSFITLKKINYLYVVSFLLVIYNFTESSDSVEETSMMDWTDICVDGFEKSVFLTVGMGISDSSVLLFSENTAILDCSIEIQTSDENVLLIVVMEFPDKKKDEESCVNPYDNTRSIIELEAITIPNNKTSVCDNINEEEEGTSIVHYILATNKVTIRLYSEGTFETMKVTSTATKRVASGGRCDEETELRCRLTESNRTTIDMCLSKELLCDGNANCGERDLHDEDPKICKASKTSHLWLVVTAGMFMMAVLVFFLVRLLRSCVPRVGDHFFIFNANEDNRLNLYPIFMKPPSPQTTDLRNTSSSRMKKVPLSHERRLSFAPKHELASYVFTEQDRAGSEIILKTSSLTSDDTALTFEDEHEQIPVNKKPALPVNKLDERKTKSSFSHVPVRLETEIPRELRSSLKNQEGRKKERDDHSFQVQVDVYSPPPFSKRVQTPTSSPLPLLSSPPQMQPLTPPHPPPSPLLQQTKPPKPPQSHPSPPIQQVKPPTPPQSSLQWTQTATPLRPPPSPSIHLSQSQTLSPLLSPVLDHPQPQKPSPPPPTLPPQRAPHAQKEEKKKKQVVQIASEALEIKDPKIGYNKLPPHLTGIQDVPKSILIRGAQPPQTGTSSSPQRIPAYSQQLDRDEIGQPPLRARRHTFASARSSTHLTRQKIASPLTLRTLKDDSPPSEDDVT